MLSTRNYREQKNISSVIAELKKCSNIDFDPEIVNEMIQILKKPSDNYDIQSTVGTNFTPSASVGYYYSDLKEDQMIISNFKFIPLDSYFSLLWTVKADAIYKFFFKGPIRIIKISGNTLIFEADKNISNNLIDRMKSILTLKYNLEVGSFSKDIVLEGKINRYYNFGDKFIFYYNYLNINQLEKDQLVRVLFKKQIRDKQLININMI